MPGEYCKTDTRVAAYAAPVRPHVKFLRHRAGRIARCVLTHAMPRTHEDATAMR